MSARPRVFARLDSASREQWGTVSIDRESGTFAVRPLRRRREYVLPLSVIAEMVCRRIIASEVATKRKAKRTRRKLSLVRVGR